MSDLLESELEEGDMFTLDGWGVSARGYKVANGRSIKTGRKMKVKTLQVWRVKRVRFMALLCVFKSDGGGMVDAADSCRRV